MYRRIVTKALNLVSNLIKFRGEQGEGALSVTPAYLADMYIGKIQNRTTFLLCSICPLQCVFQLVEAQILKFSCGRLFSYAIQYFMQLVLS